MANHEDTCGFRQVRCLYNSCGWVHSLNQLAGHLAQQHNVNVIAVQERSIELVLDEATSKVPATRVVLLLNDDQVFAAVFERAGTFLSEARLNIFCLTPSSATFDFEIVVPGPLGTNICRSRALAPGTPHDTSVGFTESFIGRMSLSGSLRLEINLTKSSPYPTMTQRAMERIVGVTVRDKKRADGVREQMRVNEILVEIKKINRRGQDM
ncbi:uncharacterized protein LOC142575821 isoform X2 [Dermacentor variabilis]|uniref:uncharacterized protein LOC142575821 isoform X2 n=1 Tax=Dermacentor variabilis TaxID=34621 RepID=UPI003F5B70FD